MSSNLYSTFPLILPTQLVPRIQRLYSSVRDVDLFLGGVIERPDSNSGPTKKSLLGPTFRCLVGDQFKRLKWGDRFWFEEGGQPNSFSQGEGERRKICRNVL